MSIRIWTVFALGVGAGAAVALMYAPQTGVKTRKQLKRNLDDATDYIRDRSDDISEYADKAIKHGRNAVDDFVTTATKVSGKVSRRVADMV